MLSTLLALALAGSGEPTNAKKCLAISKPYMQDGYKTVQWSNVCQRSFSMRVSLAGNCKAADPQNLIYTIHPEQPKEALASWKICEIAFYIPSMDDYDDFDDY